MDVKEFAKGARVRYNLAAYKAVRLYFQERVPCRRPFRSWSSAVSSSTGS